MIFNSISVNFLSEAKASQNGVPIFFISWHWNCMYTVTFHISHLRIGLLYLFWHWHSLLQVSIMKYASFPHNNTVISHCKNIVVSVYGIGYMLNMLLEQLISISSQFRPLISLTSLTSIFRIWKRNCGNYRSFSPTDGPKIYIIMNRYHYLFGVIITFPFESRARGKGVMRKACRVSDAWREKMHELL